MPKVDVTNLKLSTVVRKIEELRKKNKKPYLKSSAGKTWIVITK